MAKRPSDSKLPFIEMPYFYQAILVNLLRFHQASLASNQGLLCRCFAVNLPVFRLGKTGVNGWITGHTRADDKRLTFICVHRGLVKTRIHTTSYESVNHFRIIIYLWSFPRIRPIYYDFHYKSCNSIESPNCRFYKIHRHWDDMIYE